MTSKSKGAGLSSAAKRIQKELAEISLDPPSNCSAGPKGDNIYEWVSTILGPGSKFQIVDGTLTKSYECPLSKVCPINVQTSNFRQTRVLIYTIIVR